MSNSPVNHVGMTVAIEDLPPLMWHAELGEKLTDVWTASNHRGVQLNDAREAVERWLTRYGQRCWLRQMSPDIDHEQENRLLRVIARMDGNRSRPRRGSPCGGCAVSFRPGTTGCAESRSWTRAFANPPDAAGRINARAASNPLTAPRQWQSPTRRWA